MGVAAGTDRGWWDETVSRCTSSWTSRSLRCAGERCGHRIESPKLGRASPSKDGRGSRGHLPDRPVCPEHADLRKEPALPNRGDPPSQTQPALGRRGPNHCPGTRLAARRRLAPALEPEQRQSQSDRRGREQSPPDKASRDDRGDPSAEQAEVTTEQQQHEDGRASRLERASKLTLTKTVAVHLEMFPSWLARCSTPGAPARARLLDRGLLPHPRLDVNRRVYDSGLAPLLHNLLEHDEEGVAAPSSSLFQADPVSVLLSLDVGLYTSDSLSDQILTVMGLELDSECSPSNSGCDFQPAILNHAAR